MSWVRLSKPPATKDRQAFAALLADLSAKRASRALPFLVFKITALSARAPYQLKGENGDGPPDVLHTFCSFAENVFDFVWPIDPPALNARTPQPRKSAGV